MTEAQTASGMPQTAAHDAQARPRIAGAEAEVWTERMLSALVNGVKGGKWFSLVDKVYAPKTLALAWAKVRANKGAAGVDGQSVDRFAAQAELYLSELSAALKDGTYRPDAVKRVDIPKSDGRTRPLGIPTVKDRIVQQAVRLVIEPIFESGFADGSAACPGQVGSRREPGASVRAADAMTRYARSCWKHASRMTG